MLEGGANSEASAKPEQEEDNVFLRAYKAGIIAVPYGIPGKRTATRSRPGQSDAEAAHITPEGEGEYGEF